MSFLKGIFLLLTLLLGYARPFPDCIFSAKTLSFASFRLLRGLHTAKQPKGREEQQQDQINHPPLTTCPKDSYFGKADVPVS